VSYRIEYTSEGEHKKMANFGNRIFLTIGFFICFLWMVNTYWPEGRDLLKRILIPGDPEVIMQAAEVFAQELSSGFTVTDAAKNFCIAIMEHGYTG